MVYSYTFCYHLISPTSKFIIIPNKKDLRYIPPLKSNPSFNHLCNSSRWLIFLPVNFEVVLIIEAQNSTTQSADHIKYYAESKSIECH
ncbi:hypothetical protein QQG55_11125 [Brugia pahangi]